MTSSPPSYWLYALLGLASFAVVTLALRLTPAPLFEGRVAWAYWVDGALVVLMLAGIASMLARVPAAYRPGVAAALAAPAMAADAVVTFAFPTVFPHVDAALRADFGAAMLGGYAMILFVGLFMGPRGAAAPAP